MKKVLLISHTEDGTCKLISERLEEMKRPYHLIDLSMFPKTSVGTIQYADSLKVAFQYQEKTFSIDDVRSVWWRRPKGKNPTIPQNPLETYIAMESEVFIRSLFYCLPKTVRWISDPDKTRIANTKPLQLKIAKEIGLRIPKTIISNDPNTIKDFIVTNNDIPLTMKPVATALYPAPTEEGGNRSIYTQVIDKDQVLENIHRVKNCPVIFQEAIVEKIDLRATVVGDAVFTVSITHNHNVKGNKQNLDWRHCQLDRIYKQYILPKEMQKQCIELVKKLDLYFGAIDLCVSSEGDYYFFEINPQGQWVPSEIVAQLPISHALAKLLVK